MPEGGTRSKTSDEHLSDLREELLHDPDKAKRLEEFLFDAEHLQDAKTPSELQDRLDEMQFKHNATAYRTTDDTDADATLDGKGRSLQQLVCKPLDLFKKVIQGFKGCVTIIECEIPIPEAPVRSQSAFFQCQLLSQSLQTSADDRLP